jgi:hypothetical protein
LLPRLLDTCAQNGTSIKFLISVWRSWFLTIMISYSCVWCMGENKFLL